MNDRQFQLKLENGDLSQDDILKYVVFGKNKQIDRRKFKVKEHYGRKQRPCKLNLYGWEKINDENAVCRCSVTIPRS